MTNDQLKYQLGELRRRLIWMDSAMENVRHHLELTKKHIDPTDDETAIKAINEVMGVVNDQLDPAVMKKAIEIFDTILNEVIEKPQEFAKTLGEVEKDLDYLIRERTHDLTRADAIHFYALKAVENRKYHHEDFKKIIALSEEIGSSLLNPKLDDAASKITSLHYEVISDD